MDLLLLKLSIDCNPQLLKGVTVIFTHCMQ